MIQLNLSAYLLIAGCALVLLATSVGPPRLYQEPDSQKQLENIENHRDRWLLSNLMFGLGGLSTAVGLILFSLYAQREVHPLLNWLAALGYALGTVLWLLFLYNRTIKPGQLFENYAFTPQTIVLIGSLLLGLLIYGIIYLQAGYPGWLGSGTIGLALLIGALAMLFPDRFFASFPPQLLYLFTLAAGIVFLGQQ